MQFNEPVILGKTGLLAGRLGVSESYGAPTEAFEEAFEHGCNYFLWGTLLRGRSSRMKRAIKNIIAKGHRDKLIIALPSYAHNAMLGEWFFHRALKSLGVKSIDVFLLAFYAEKPSQKILDSVMKLKEKGLIKHIGISGHNRKLFASLHSENIFDLFQARYNASNRGAEHELFDQLPLERNQREGIVSFTATRWKSLLKPENMPDREQPLTATDCYRFVLSHPKVDICLTAPATREQMKGNLKTLQTGPLSNEEMIRIKKIGDYVYSQRDK